MNRVLIWIVAAWAFVAELFRPCPECKRLGEECHDCWEDRQWGA